MKKLNSSEMASLETLLGRAIFNKQIAIGAHEPWEDDPIGDSCTTIDEDTLVMIGSDPDGGESLLEITLPIQSLLSVSRMF